jgi:ribose transport system substrate-binding protein
MKKVLALVLAMMLVLSAAAFAADYEIVSKGFQHQYWQAVLKGAQQKAEELGVEINFVGPANESAYDEQLSQLNSAINAAPKAIGLAALSTETCLDAIKTAQESGIPIIGFDSGVPGAPEGAILANCATNNYNAGALAGEMVYAAIKDRIAAAEGTVRIGVSAQDAVSESVTQRGLGFIDKIGELAAADGYTVKLEGNEKYVNDAKVESVDDGKIVIETLVPSQVTAELSAIDCQNLLNKSDIIALYGSNQHSAEAMVTANENLQKLGTGEGQVMISGIDGTAEALQAVKDGQMAQTVLQDAPGQGAAAVDVIKTYMAGEKPDAEVLVPYVSVTAENVDEYLSK